MVQKIVEHFEIPDELSKELSELLTKQAIREKLLLQLITEEEKYLAAEKLLIPITSKIEAIKAKITKEFVPTKFQFDNYMWNYNGYEIDRNKVEVIEQS